jgi:hypothetical protein
MFHAYRPHDAGSARTHRRGFGRRGNVTLEFIVALPILTIALLAIIEYGLFFANMQQVALACRVGVKAASQTDDLPLASGTVPAPVLDAIGQQLRSCGISPCAVFLEHDVPGSEQELVATFDSGCACHAPATPLPSPPGGARSVRVTVCVPMGELAPNCLALFGLDLANRVAKSTTTFRYQRSKPECVGPTSEKVAQATVAGGESQ